MLPKRLAGLEEIALPGCPRVLVARSASSRLVGLAGLRDVPAELGLLIPRCHSIHTFGMRFALDVTFLDAEWSVLRRVEAVPPGRLLWQRGAAAVLERRAA